MLVFRDTNPCHLRVADNSLVVRHCTGADLTERTTNEHPDYRRLAIVALARHTAQCCQAGHTGGETSFQMAQCHASFADVIYVHAEEFGRGEPSSQFCGLRLPVPVFCARGIPHRPDPVALTTPASQTASSPRIILIKTCIVCKMIVYNLYSSESTVQDWCTVLDQTVLVQC